MNTYSKLINIIFLTLLFTLLPVKSSFATVLFDSTFGINGKVITKYGHESYISKTILQADGKIISVGAASNGNNLDWAIARYNSDGSLDKNFGTDGKVTKDFGGDDSIADVKVQPDGKIIVGRYSHMAANFQWTLARFNSNGLIDNSFGNNGIVTSFAGIHSVMNDVELQSDGKIVAAGYRQSQGQDDVAVTRYNPDGTLDSTFGGGDGIVTLPISTWITPNDRGNAAVIQPDGKIIVFGDFDAGWHNKIFLARFNSDGSLDTSFGSGGKIIDSYEYHNGARDIALQSDGKILVTGSTGNTTSSDNTYIARYDSDGKLDTSFGGSGKIVKSFSSGNDGANSLILQPDGKIILGGYEDTGGAAGTDFALRRFNTDGSLDTEFGTGGSFVTPIGSGSELINSLALQNDGKIIAAGSVSNSNGSYNDWGLVRYQWKNEETLNIPYFSQNEPSPFWGPSEYDHAYSLGATGMSGSMNWWGCAVTSVAMMLNFHDIKQFVDGSVIDPGSLNQWLKKNGGFVKGYDEKGEWYSSLDWSRIGTLTEQISTRSGTPKLEWKRLAATDENLNTELSNKRPPIIQVKNTLTTSHFVVAKGIKDDNYSINDPEWNYPDLTNFNKNFYQIDSFKPSNTNLSYLVIVVNPEVEILVTDPLNRKTGKHIINGTTQSYNEIPEAFYGYEEPISNPGDGEDPKSFGTGVNSFILPTPTNGDYTIVLSGNKEKFYTINISTTEKDGAHLLNTFQGTTAPKDDDVSIVNYSQDMQSDVEKSVTFESLKSDLRELFNLGLIDNKRIYNSLLVKVKLAKKASDMKIQPLGKKLAIASLKVFLFKLNTQRGKHVKEEAYQILSNDASLILKNL